MALDLYVNMAASSAKNALVLSEDDMKAVRLQDFVLGDTVPIRLFLVDGNGAFDTRSGDATYGIKIGIGPLGGSATQGSFTLTFGGDTTADIAFDSTPEEVEAALELLASIGAGNLRVYGNAPYYLVEFIGSLALANQAAMTADGSGLYPDTTVTIDTITGGDATHNEKQSIRLVRQPAALQTTWTTITSPANGWEGDLGCNTYGMLALLDGETQVDSVFEIQLTDPSGNHKTIAQQRVLVKNELIEESSLVPLQIIGSAGQWTNAQLDQMFVKWLNNPAGNIVVLKSPNGTKTRSLGVDNNGQPIDFIS